MHTAPSANPPAGATASGSGAARVDPRRALGSRGEAVAAAHLSRLGFSILARNERTRYGEIDLIAFDGRALVFVEVKSRLVEARAGSACEDQQPLARLRPRQRARLRRLAVAWLANPDCVRPTAHTIRFDAIGVILDSRHDLVRLEHLQGAW
jgi:putative endonuclease